MHSHTFVLECVAKALLILYAFNVDAQRLGIKTRIEQRLFCDRWYVLAQDLGCPVALNGPPYTYTYILYTHTEWTSLHTYIYTYIHIHIYTYTHVRMHTYTHIHKYTKTQVRTHIYPYTHKHKLPVFTKVNWIQQNKTSTQCTALHAPTAAHTHTHTHTHTTHTLGGQRDRKPRLHVFICHYNRRPLHHMLSWAINQQRTAFLGVPPAA